MEREPGENIQLDTGADAESEEVHIYSVVLRLYGRNVEIDGSVSGEPGSEGQGERTGNAGSSPDIEHILWSADGNAYPGSDEE